MTRIHTLAAAALLTTALATAACGVPQSAPPVSAPSVHPDSVTARADRGRMKGSDSAQVTIVEISDFECPYCREFATTTFARIDSAYVRTGRARVVYINLPLSIHRDAFAAAEAAMCASAQDKFWPMHDRLFATQSEWRNQADAGRRFEQMAQALQLDMAAYRDCTANDRTASVIISDATEATQAGVQGTPAFILTSRSGQRALSGAVPFEQFAREMDALLAAQPAAGAQTQPQPPQP